jgi:hypothetical protein
MIFITFSLVVSSLPINIANGQEQQSSSTTSNGRKVAILTFGDTLKSQITTAKPYCTNMDLRLAFLLHVNG